MHVNEWITGATGVPLGSSRGKLSSTVRPIEDIFRPARRPIFRCSGCGHAYHPFASPYNRLQKPKCPKCGSDKRTWILAVGPA